MTQHRVKRALEIVSEDTAVVFFGHWYKTCDPQEQEHEHLEGESRTADSSDESRSGSSPEQQCGILLAAWGYVFNIKTGV